VDHDLGRKLQEAQNILHSVKDSVKDNSTETICEKISNDNTTNDNLGNHPEVERMKDICRAPEDKK
jgi:hypothetical protein